MSQPGRERESIPTVIQLPLKTPTPTPTLQEKNGFDVDICDMAEYGEGNGVRLELNEDQLRNAF